MKDTTVLGRSQPHDDLIPVSLSFSLSLSPLSVSPVSSPQSHGAICKPTQPQWNRSQPEEEHKVREAFYALCVCVCGITGSSLVLGAPSCATGWFIIEQSSPAQLLVDRAVACG